MSKSLKTTLLLLSFLILAFAVAGAVGVKPATTSADGAYRQLGVYNDVLLHIRSDYVEEPDLQKVNSGALHGLVEALDGSSSYLSADEYKRLQQLPPATASTGAVISKRFGYAIVVAVAPGSPADKAGLASGDILESIEDRSSRELSLAEINGLLGGAPGTSVTVAVVHPTKAQPQKLTLVRQTLRPVPVGSRMVEAQTGYLRPEGFAKGRSQEIAARLRELERNGAKKIVLDLRNSADGDPAEGVATANLFLNFGKIAYVEGQKYPRQNFVADAAKAICALPLVVIVNKSTAGAAEIVAGAIQDNGRGQIVGDKTFGLGSIQKTIHLQDGGVLILSVAKYYTPTGKAIQDVAITPTVLVADKSDDYIAPEGTPELPEDNAKPKNQPDEPLQRALELLRQPTATTTKTK